MKVIFVGMHNKPEMKPLDSKTKTGKVVDRIIAGLNGFECQKSNLFEMDYHPEEKKEIWAANLHWNEKYQPSSDDIIVLLGSWVHKEFLLTNANIIKVGHPAGFFYRSNKNTDEYVISVISKITKATKKINNDLSPDCGI